MSGNDILSGDEGDDVIHGQRGSDVIHGGDGDDEIFGDEGSDKLLAGDNVGLIYFLLIVCNYRRRTLLQNFFFAKREKIFGYISFVAFIYFALSYFLLFCPFLFLFLS